MAYVQSESRDQLMLPFCLEDMIEQSNPVRVIDAFVDQLPLTSMGFSHSTLSYTGRPPYDPAALLKLYLYGYLNRIRSSRQLMKECRRNVELFYLLGHLTPDFRTIADFRKQNADAIRQVFRHFVQLCQRCNLFGNEVAVDGSKFRAVNGKKNMYNAEILQSKMERIERQMNLYLKELDQWDQAEREEQPESNGMKYPEKIREAIRELRERKLRYQQYQKELELTGETQLLTTDPESRMMQSKDGFHCCYNVQTAVDTTSHLIADYLVTNKPNDQQILSGFTQQVKAELKQEVLSTVADKGYDSQNEILSCICNGVLPYVGFRYDQGERLYILPYEQQPITEKMRESSKPADIQACLNAAVLPKIYENSHLSLEIHSEYEIGCFHRGLDKKTVTCPMGFTLKKTRERERGMEYACKPACRQCTNRCTPSRRHKTVLFGPGTEYVAARMYGKQKPVITQPLGFLPHNSFYRKSLPPITVMLRVSDDKERQKMRLCVSEHPFGTVKWSHGAYYLLCKGIKKTTAELGLSFTAYNLKRAINLVGAEKLIEKIREV